MTMKRKRKARPQSQESQLAKAAIMEALDNQLRNNDPPETRATYERLKQKGIDEAETRRLLACVIAAEIYDVMKNESAFNLARFTGRLSGLPDTPWMEEG
jgi:hypothetical protein